MNAKPRIHVIAILEKINTPSIPQQLGQGGLFQKSDARLTFMIKIVVYQELNMRKINGKTSIHKMG